MARASCITKYCPLLEDIELPPQGNAHMWGKDGLPNYITLKMRNWKGRKKSTPYSLRIWRNLLQPDFADPVFFLMVWISHLGFLGITTGPLFPDLTRGKQLNGGVHMKPKQWMGMVQHVFEKVRCTGSEARREGMRMCVLCAVWAVEGWSQRRRAVEGVDQPFAPQSRRRMGRSLWCLVERCHEHGPLEGHCHRDVVPRTRHGVRRAADARSSRRRRPHSEILGVSANRRSH